MKQANVHFSREWDAYTRARGERMYYLFDDTYVLPIRTKTVAFLRAGILDTEPFALCEGTAPEQQTEFLNAACKLLRRAHIAWVQCDPSACFTAYPSIRGTTTLRRGNYILDLQQTDEAMFKGVHSKQRNMIRRGEKEGLEIRVDTPEVLADYKSIEDQVWERNNMPKQPLSYYETMKNSLGDACSVVVAYDGEGVPQAGGVFLVSDAMAYYHHGASRDRCTPGAHAYVMWKQFLYLRDRGVQKLNFVGYRPGLAPDNKGYTIQHFKERFGGPLMDTYFFRYVSSSLLYKVYRLASVILYHDTYKDFFDEQAVEFPELNP